MEAKDEHWPTNKSDSQNHLITQNPRIFIPNQPSAVTTMNNEFKYSPNQAAASEIFGPTPDQNGSPLIFPESSQSHDLNN